MPDYTGKEGEPSEALLDSAAPLTAPKEAAAWPPLVLQRDAVGKLTPASKLQLRAYAAVASVMRESETTGRLYSALAKAQGSFPVIETNKDASIKSKKGEESSYKYRYATLDQVIDAVRPPLSANGIVLMQPVTQVAGTMVLVTRLILGIDTPSDGSITEWVEVVLPLRMSEDYQALASAITYLRRLSLSALLGVAADQDDDGNRASKREQRYSIEDKNGGGPNWPEMLFDLSDLDSETEATLVQLERQLVRATDMLDVGLLLKYWNRRSPLILRARKQHPAIEIYVASAFYEGTHRVLGRRLSTLLSQAIRMEKAVDANFLEIAMRDEMAKAALGRLKEKHFDVAGEFGAAIGAELARLPDGNSTSTEPQTAPATAEVSPLKPARRKAPVKAETEAAERSADPVPAEPPEQDAASPDEPEDVGASGQLEQAGEEGETFLRDGEGDILGSFTVGQAWIVALMDEWRTLSGANRAALEAANDETLRAALSAGLSSVIDSRIYGDDLRVDPPIGDNGQPMVAAYISAVRQSLAETGLVAIRRWEALNKPIYTAQGMPLTVVQRIASELHERRTALGLSA